MLNDTAAIYAAKNLILYCVIIWKILYSGRGIQIWLGGSLLGGIFSDRGDEPIFGYWGNYATIVYFLFVLLYYFVWCTSSFFEIMLPPVKNIKNKFLFILT